MANTILSVSSDRLDSLALQHLTADLSRDINGETDITATTPQGKSEDGAKGEPITIGVILLAFLTTGTAVALLNVIRAYFERDSMLKVEFQREDGRRLSISAENVNSSQIDQTMVLAKNFFKDQDE